MRRFCTYQVEDAFGNRRNYKDAERAFAHVGETDKAVYELTYELPTQPNLPFHRPRKRLVKEERIYAK